ncbi:conserved hypothetical protein [Shewanella sediminis HAW-EB3]|uniref:DUF2909 domain-containing protein n=1 Tax=Shewanella sediminis (strain HAW-EB3) TaxID=425104 RepID=A8FPN4_SHESH|nr:conserved hypothetical protein [Shewanella sediminis HAW-EB3]
MLLLLFIVFNLAKALFLLVKGDSETPMSQFLGRRVIFSVVAVLIILLAIGTGILSPNPRPY